MQTNTVSAQAGLRAPPVLKETKDPFQKTFKCNDAQTLKKWREALALRYYNNPDPGVKFSVRWEDRDHEERCLKIPLITEDPAAHNLAKTFVQVYKDDVKKCISITLYFLKRSTRKKGCGTCLIQGDYCPTWAKGEFDCLCAIVSKLLDTDQDVGTVLTEARAPAGTVSSSLLEVTNDPADPAPADHGVVTLPADHGEVTLPAPSADIHDWLEQTDTDPDSDVSDNSDLDRFEPVNTIKQQSDQHVICDMIIETETDNTSVDHDYKRKPTDNDMQDKIEKKHCSDDSNGHKPPEIYCCDLTSSSQLTLNDIDHQTESDRATTKYTKSDNANNDRDDLNNDKDNLDLTPVASPKPVPASATSKPIAGNTMQPECRVEEPVSPTGIYRCTTDPSVQPVCVTGEAVPSNDNSQHTDHPAVQSVCSGVTSTPEDSSAGHVELTDNENSVAKNDSGSTANTEGNNVSNPTNHIDNHASNPTNSAGPTMINAGSNTDNHVCIKCSAILTPLCTTCIQSMNADFKCQMDNKIRMMRLDMQRELDDLRQECQDLKFQVKEQSRTINSVTDRQKQLMKENKNLQQVIENITNNKETELLKTPKVKETTVGNDNKAKESSSNVKRVDSCGSSQSSVIVNSAINKPDANQSNDKSPLPPPVSNNDTPIDHSEENGFRKSGKSVPKYKIRLPLPGKVNNFILGDSNLQYIDRQRLDRTGMTHVRTMPRAKVVDVTAALSECAVRGDVRRVALHVGGNDIHKDCSKEMLSQDLSDLLGVAKRVFPSAIIAVTALLPRKQLSLRFIDALNDELRQTCAYHNVAFILEDKFVDEKSKMIRSLFSTDGIHLSVSGLSLWLRRVIQFLAIHENHPSLYKKNKWRTNQESNVSSGAMADNDLLTRRRVNQHVITNIPPSPLSSHNRNSSPDIQHKATGDNGTSTNSSHSADERNGMGSQAFNPSSNQEYQQPMPQWHCLPPPYPILPNPNMRGYPSQPDPMQINPKMAGYHFPPMWPFSPFPPLPFNPWAMQRSFSPYSG